MVKYKKSSVKMIDCGKCGAKESIKYSVFMTKDEVEIKISRCQECKYQYGVKELWREQEGVKKPDNISPNDGGCWFCHTKDDDMVFDTEFDTHVHIECIKKALKKNSNDPEAKLMKYLIPPDSICGVNSIGAWCYNCEEDKMKCKLYLDKLR